MRKKKARRFSDKERLDWIERDWTPREELLPVLEMYENQDCSLRFAIDAAMRAER